MKTNALIEKAKSMASLHHEKVFIYKLTHTHDSIPRPLFVQARIEPTIMDLLIAFVQFKSAEISETYGMSQEDVALALTQCYECKVIDEMAGAIEIDLYENLEAWCSYSESVQWLPLFEQPYLDKILFEIIQKDGLHRKYSDSVDRFAVSMKDQLELNSRKGHWATCDAQFLLGQIQTKAAELEEAIANGESANVIAAKAADLSNYSMMLQENYRRDLERAKDAARGRELLDHLFEVCGISRDEDVRRDLWTRLGKVYTWIDERGETEWNGNKYRLVNSDPDVATRVDEAYTLILGEPLHLPPDAIIQEEVANDTITTERR